MLQAIIFDLDQTLIDRSETFRLFLDEQYDRIFGHSVEISKSVFINKVFEHDNNGYTAKEELYDTICELLAITSVSSTDLLADFKSNYGRWPVLFDGVHEILSHLQGEYKLALITNGRTRGQNFKIDQSKIRSYFSVIKISEEEGVKKPNPQIFESCLKALKLEAGDCVYVGDHPINDVRAAKGVGMLGVWVESKCYSPPLSHDGTIRDIADLPALVEAIDSLKN